MESAKNPKEIEYHPTVQKQIDILNAVLSSCDKPNIFENSDVTFDEWWVYENCLKFQLRRERHNSLSLRFYLQSDSMRIDVGAHNKSCEFVEQDVLEDIKVTETLVSLLCSPVMIERKGNATFVNLFNQDGSKFAIWAFQSFVALVTRGYWKSQSLDQHLFDPIYGRTK